MLSQKCTYRTPVILLFQKDARSGRNEKTITTRTTSKSVCITSLNSRTPITFQLDEHTLRPSNSALQNSWSHRFFHSENLASDLDDELSYHFPTVSVLEYFASGLVEKLRYRALSSVLKEPLIIWAEGRENLILNMTRENPSTPLLYNFGFKNSFFMLLQQ